MLTNCSNLINAQEVQYLLSCDMKTANIVCGVQSHSSMHPCCWCDTDSKNLNLSGSPQTIESLKKHHKAFIESWADLKKAKAFKNVHSPILTSSCEKSLVLDLITPMELHLMMGVVNHLKKFLKETCP